MKAKIIGLALIITVIFLTGCSNKEEKDYKLLKCTRDAQSEESNVDLSLNYEVYYKDDLVKKLIATDKVTSKDKSILEQYINSYQQIYSKYDELDHFKNDITIKNDSMTSVTEIDYAHINTDKLLKIEGKEDNVVNEDGKVILKDFISFYEKYGAECDDIK